MEQYLLHALGIFFVGIVCGAGLVLAINKLRSGSASPGKIKREYESYQEEVESHFEETSKKFKEMTEQYQDLYRHLSVGATSLCRPDSVAAALADQSDPMSQAPQLEQSAVDSELNVVVDKEPSAKEPSAKEPSAKQPSAKEPSAKQPSAKQPSASKSASKSANEEPSASKGKKPSASKDKEPSASKGKKPSAKPAQKSASERPKDPQKSAQSGKA